MVNGNLNVSDIIPIIVEKVVTGKLPAAKVAALADKLSTLPLWADQHKALGID